MEECFTFHRYSQPLLPEDTQGQFLKLLESRTDHTVSYHPDALREGDINFYDSTLNWHLPTGHVNILCPAQHFICHHMSQKNDTPPQVHPHLQNKFFCNKPATTSRKQTVFLTRAEAIQRRIFFLLLVHFFLLNSTSKERKMKLPETGPEDAYLTPMVNLGTAGSMLEDELISLNHAR